MVHRILLYIGMVCALALGGYATLTGQKEVGDSLVKAAANMKEKADALEATGDKEAAEVVNAAADAISASTTVSATSATAAE